MKTFSELRAKHGGLQEVAHFNSSEQMIQFIQNRQNLLKDKIIRVQKDKREIEDFFNRIHTSIKSNKMTRDGSVVKAMGKLEKEVRKAVDMKITLNGT